MARVLAGIAGDHGTALIVERWLPRLRLSVFKWEFGRAGEYGVAR